MAIRLHLQFPEAVYHVMFCGNGLLRSSRSTHNLTSTRAYDVLGRQVSARTNANGSVSRYFHSSGGKLLREEHPPGTDDVSYDYDAHGNQIVAESADFRYDYFYDSQKLRRDAEHVINGGMASSILRRYDSTGRDAGFTAYIGASATQDVHKAYDSLGRLESISAIVGSAAPIAVTNHYDGSRHVGYSVHAGNCIVIREVVYGQNRDVIESVINSVVTNGVTNVVSRFDYAYDGAGRRTRRGDTALPSASTNLFTYNPRSELTAASMSGGEYLYGYDSQGNRLFSTNGAVGSVFVTNGLNQYVEVDGVEPTYDLDGNLTVIPGRMAMGYDAKNQLTYVSNATWRVWNTYDHLGRRIKKRTQTPGAYGSTYTYTYLYDGWNMIAETINTAAPRHYLWGLDLSGTEQGAGGVGGLLGFTLGTTWFIPLYDANGNVTGYVSANTGKPAKQFEYDAFGNITYQNSSPNIFRYRFSTKFFDHETGLYYYGRRFYDPIWSRWINRDPVEEDGGLNLYAFCGNDGVNTVDVLGMLPEIESGSHCIVVCDRPVSNFPLANHYALERWVGCCPKEKEEIDIEKWTEKYSVARLDKMELLSRPGNKAWKWDGSSWKYVDINVSVIYYGFPEGHLENKKAATIVAGNRTTIEVVWNLMKAKAQFYDWAEQDGNSGSFLNFPRSVYRIGSTVHNSNTFVRHVADRFMFELSMSHPGRKTVDNALKYNNIYRNPNMPLSPPVGLP